MQTSFIQVQDGKVIIDQNQLMSYAVLAAIIIVLLIVILIAFKRRKKDFIKTVPTNLKDEV